MSLHLVSEFDSRLTLRSEAVSRDVMEPGSSKRGVARSHELVATPDAGNITLGSAEVETEMLSRGGLLFQ